ncbi:MAG: protein-L-isoaspartate(D-aspartate) O-methyltransferase [Clostridiales bacterium]|jgi:protein-L-isoaspartate(D-aspartate) O-methyltransferase|nr:protein-L-isoaspartate(D-aspartate) O-methyltransferase [Clostridiales bacterium]
MANMRFPQDIFYGIKDQRIIEVINSIPREDFLPESLRDYAYADTALPIGSGQTISQPSLVAYMTQLLELTGRERVLEIGTGSGYQTAILAGLVQEVYTVEIIPELHEEARQALDKMGIDNVRYKLGSGYEGWEEYAPFDGIMVTAAPPEIPQKLVEQLGDKGRMVVPVGDRNQTQILKLIVKSGDTIIEEDKSFVRFVPMVE